MPRPREVPSEAVPVMMIDYMGLSLDTTIFGISSGVWLFAKKPRPVGSGAQRSVPDSRCSHEILRLEAPIQDFSRYVAPEYDFEASGCRKARAPSFSTGRQSRFATISASPSFRRPAQQCRPSHGIWHRTARMPRHEPRQTGDALPFRGARAAGQALPHRSGRACAEQRLARFQQIDCYCRIGGQSLSMVNFSGRAMGTAAGPRTDT